MPCGELTRLVERGNFLGYPVRDFHWFCYGVCFALGSRSQRLVLFHQHEKHEQMSTTATQASGSETNSPSPASGEMETFVYDDQIVRMFAAATIIWGLVATLAGVIVAVFLVMPQLTEGLPWLSFGRLRPLHTNAAIFAFAGNAIFAAIYYSTQRLCKARMWSDTLSHLHFWGWQAIIVAAAITLPLGITQSKEYAELEWPIDIAIAVVWLFIFGGNFLMTLVHRRERHMYVALWFYIATIVTVALLHVFNNLVIPTGLVSQLSDLRGRARRLYAVVVRAQCGGLLFDDALPGPDVLLPTQGGGAPGIQLQAEHHSLLVAGLYLHLGRSAPLALHLTARVGQHVGNVVQFDAVDAQLGWHDQWSADPAWCVAQGGCRPDSEVLRGGRDILWHEYL